VPTRGEGYQSSSLEIIRQFKHDLRVHTLRESRTELEARAGNFPEGRLGGRYCSEIGRLAGTPIGAWSDRHIFRSERSVRTGGSKWVR
jgi:hypothetical protein